jgi:hypothetical protein
VLLMLLGFQGSEVVLALLTGGVAVGRACQLPDGHLQESQVKIVSA